MTKLQKEWLKKIAERPVWYQYIPESARKVFRKNGWTTVERSGMQLCHVVTQAGLDALAEAETKAK